jgi:response regulator NasT
MSNASIERRLFEVAKRIRAANEELAVVDEQLQALREAADEARVRSLVSETPLAHKEYTEAQPPWPVRSPTSVARRTSCWTSWWSDEVSRPWRRAKQVRRVDGDPRVEGVRPVAVRVVIAEDEAIVRLDLKEILEEEGYDVVGETGRGDEAVDLVRTRRPDLAILDIKMPGSDGLTAAREITSEHLAAVLILTAFSQRDLIEQARAAGALAYLVKPFQKSELLPAIEIALGRFGEMKALDEQVKSLEERLEVRTKVERAKGVLMDALDMREHDAFNWIQKTAMRQRLPMKEVARRVVEDGLRPTE